MVLNIPKLKILEKNTHEFTKKIFRNKWQEYGSN